MLDKAWSNDLSELSLDNQDLLSALILDLYTIETSGDAGVNIITQNVDLVSNKTTTSTSFVSVTSGSITFTPSKANCEIVVSNIDAQHSGASEVQFRVRCNNGAFDSEAMAVMSGSTSRPLQASVKYTSMPIGTPSTIQLEFRVATGGTATILGTTWIVFEVIEYD